MSGLGSILQLKPILTMKNGLPGSDRVRTSAKAENRLISLLEDHLPIEKFAVVHTHAQDKAQGFVDKVKHLIPKGKYYSMDITPVIGAHIGPGAFGYAIVTRRNKSKNKNNQQGKEKP
jgi:fatty acid-binding protein DegV